MADIDEALDDAEVAIVTAADHTGPGSKLTALERTSWNEIGGPQVPVS